MLNILQDEIAVVLCYFAFRPHAGDRVALMQAVRLTNVCVLLDVQIFESQGRMWPLLCTGTYNSGPMVHLGQLLPTVSGSSCPELFFSLPSKNLYMWRC